MYRIIGADGVEYGPVTAEQIRQWIAEGRANAQTRVRLDGSVEWRTLGELPEFGLSGGGQGVAGPPPGRVVPTSLKVFSVLNMVFGGLGLLCAPLNLLAIPLAMRSLGESKPVRGWLLFSAVWGIIGAALLLASGIGLWKLKAWARKLAIAYAVLAIVVGLAGWAVLVASLRAPGELAGPEWIGGLVGGAVGTVVGLAYNILLIVFLSRRAAKVATGEVQ